jgi:hypothetical protein
MSVEEVAKLSYAAGLFDGEGCVLFYIRRDHTIIYAVEVANCDRRALDWLQANFGGRINVKTMRRKHTLGMWTLNGPRATVFAKAILPYSILKREQLELFIEAREQINTRGAAALTEDQKLLREEYAAEIKRLKRPQWVLA